jgi:hypothetical protein
MSFKEVLESVRETLHDLKQGYDSENRFGKMRMWITGIVGLDVIVTILLVFFATGPSLAVDAWYEEAFPSNLIVLRNRGDELKDVEVVVDTKYHAKVSTLQKGATGLEIDREFRDNLDFAPPATYTPKLLVIHAEGHTRQVELRPGKRK